MTKMRIVCMGILVAVAFGSNESNQAGDICCIHCTRARIPCRLPELPPGHEYRVNQPIPSIRVLSELTADWPAGTKVTALTVVNSGIYAPNVALANPYEIANRSSWVAVDASRAVNVYEKRFQWGDTMVNLAPAHLARMGAILYDDGRFAFTGILSHDGGPGGSWQGANVLVRLNLLAGTPIDGAPQGAAAVLASSTAVHWVDRDRPLDLVISANFNDPTGRLFAQATHVELYMEIQGSR
ncbi:MAG TPA: hypothetical protein VGP63_08300 [Planctomycetaceae bacterium]|jgi:hypothetical protein|nr:hypothetical protein [Planctomycetaceae bacterium]